MSFEESIKKVESLFIYNGLTLKSRYIDRKTKWKNLILFIFNFIWVNTDAIGGVLWMADSVRDTGAIGDVTYMAPCSVLTFLSFVKAILFLYYEDCICDLVVNFRELDKCNRLDVQKDIDFLHLILKASKILNISLCIAFPTIPLVASLVFYLRDGVFEVIYPYRIKYPFDDQDARFWPFVYIHQCWSTCVVLSNILGPDHLLYVCCTYLRVQLRLLSYDFQMTVNKNSHLAQRGFEEKCIPLIQWHQTLIELAENLESVYTKSTLSNFVSSSILICLTGFNVVSVNNVVVTAMFLIFLSANLAQIFLLCYFGDLVMTSSMEVSSSLYNSKWYKVDSKAAKNLLIVHFRSLKPCKLTAFGFSDVSLMSFMSILSSAWSYFALLKTVATPTKI